MMLSVLVWLAMQGQVDKGIDWHPLQGCVETADHVTCPSWQPSPLPAEHVIEIKTLKTPTGKTWVCSFVAYGEGGPPCRLEPKLDYCPPGCRCEDEMHVTRELWIDGVRYGNIKGLD